MLTLKKKNSIGSAETCESCTALPQKVDAAMMLKQTVQICALEFIGEDTSMRDVSTSHITFTHTSYSYIFFYVFVNTKRLCFTVFTYIFMHY